ncbi:MAG TPA: pirin family protein [Labilithrix sp.]|jgi:redox-sensitive bicupin YhaK (pirin superfamily)
MTLATVETPRRIVHVTRGRTHGPITRLVSPSDLGELIKPFVFLDLAHFDGGKGLPSMDAFWHPHSGIATVTVILEGGMQFAETTGRRGGLAAGGVEWMRAGNAVWHTGAPDAGRGRLFQLWVALPPELENAPSASEYLEADEVPRVGPARVVLGEYGGKRSPIASPPLTYLDVSLESGRRWSYAPPRGHDVAWVAVHEGRLRTAAAPIAAGEVAIFERGERGIDFVAEGKAGFVLGSAAKHPHELVLGNYSVHTSPEALERGETAIRELGEKLVADGSLPEQALWKI